MIAITMGPYKYNLFILEIRLLQVLTKNVKNQTKSKIILNRHKKKNIKT